MSEKICVRVRACPGKMKQSVLLGRLCEIIVKINNVVTYILANTPLMTGDVPPSRINIQSSKYSSRTCTQWSK